MSTLLIFSSNRSVWNSQHVTARRSRPATLVRFLFVATLDSLAHVAESKTPLGYPLRLTPDRPLKTYEQREPFSLLPLLSNPMVLMMGFTFLMAIAMPYMTAGMDPEELKKMQKSQNPETLFKELFGVADVPTPAPAASASKRDKKRN
eukprot:TRINITY_DN1909_c0_g1_i2.p1 TRINITY_DN1909_c0_g1~~TRINITY_DN1909_c0_g1_i2.p1  ORF type:complete len:148 (+),score=25.70 TRINITY_DN1909_c0_g1_i2:208-651(+)